MLTAKLNVVFGILLEEFHKVVSTCKRKILIDRLEFVARDEDLTVIEKMSSNAGPIE